MINIKNIKKLLKRAVNSKSSIIIITFMAIVTATTATEKPNFVIESDSSLQEELELPENFAVYGVSTDTIYSQTLPYPIDDSGSVAVEIDLIVNSFQPALLLLEGNDVAVWDIHWTEETNILGAIVFSDYTQGVAGLPQETPVLINPLVKYKSDSCLNYTSNQRCNLEQISQKFFGRSLQKKSLQTSQAGYLIGEPIKENSVLLTSNDTPVNSFFLPNTPRIGDAGIKDALKKGILRQATTADFENWVEARIRYKESTSENVFSASERESYKAKLSSKLNRQSVLEIGYVILDDFTYPAGLFGSDYKIFFLSEDVPKPSGDPGHSSIYNSTGKCLSVTCSLTEGYDIIPTRLQ